MNKKEEHEVRVEFKKLKKYSIKYGRLEVLDELEKWVREDIYCDMCEECQHTLDNKIQKMRKNQ